jgi:hypothetical protein
MHHTQIWILVKKIMTYEDVTLLPAVVLGWNDCIFREQKGPSYPHSVVEWIRMGLKGLEFDPQNL